MTNDLYTNGHRIQSINHAMATMPNSELGGLSPAALKFGTLDIPHFDLPRPLTPGHTYCDFVTRLDNNLATVRSVTHTYQESIRKARRVSVSEN